MRLEAATTLTCLLPAIQALVPEIPGFQCAWSDDFEGPANTLPNPLKWIIDRGTSYRGGPAQWGTGEIQTYTDKLENLHVTGDGVLEITPLKDAHGNWTSSRIRTVNANFCADSGGKMRIQAKISMPAVAGDKAIGYWSAFWTLGRDFRGNWQNWPGVGEFDIMENANGLDRVWSVMHCGTAPDGPCREPGGIDGNSSCTGSSCLGNWHTYTLEVDRTDWVEVLNWYVDDKLYHSVNQDQVGYETWQQAVHSGHFVLLNVAMGGGFPDGKLGNKTPVNSTAPGFPMAVDYVAVYNA